MEEGKENNKLGLAAGIMNIVLGGVLFVDALLFLVMAACCLMMSFSLFFMAAIPAFLVCGFLAILNFGIGVVNVLLGATAVATMRKGGKISHIVSVASMIFDTVILPLNLLALAYGIYMLVLELEWVSVFILVIAALGFLLAASGLILHIVGVLRKKKEKRPATPPAKGENSANDARTDANDTKDESGATETSNETDGSNATEASRA